MTALILALGNHDLQTAQYLIESGAEVNLRLRNGDTPLIVVAKRLRFPSMAKLLIQYGADLNAEDAEGKTALRLSSEHHNDGVADVLREAAPGR